jgi:hypothetical protein
MSFESKDSRKNLTKSLKSMMMKMMIVEKLLWRDIGMWKMMTEVMYYIVLKAMFCYDDRRSVLYSVESNACFY